MYNCWPTLCAGRSGVVVTRLPATYELAAGKVGQLALTDFGPDETQ